MDRPAIDTVFPALPVWDGAGTSRIPFLAYTSDELHRRELERFFYKGHWCYVGLEAEIPNPGDFKRTAVGERSVILVARAGRNDPRRRERVRAPRHELLPRAQRQPQGLHLPVPPVELLAEGRPAGRAVQARRQAGRQGPGRHAGRLQAGGQRPHQAQGGDARRRRVRVVRRRGRAVRGLPRPGDPALVRPPVRRPHAEAPRLQPPAHPGQLEADAGKHQGPVPPGAAAHLVRHLRPLARRQQVRARDGRAPPPRGDDLDARQDRRRGAGDAGRELQGGHEARGSALPRHRPRKPGGAGRPR